MKPWVGALVGVLLAVLTVIVLLAGALHWHAYRAQVSGAAPPYTLAPNVYPVVEGKSGAHYPYTPDVLRIPAGRVVTIRLTDYLGGCGLVTVFPGLAPGGGDARARVPVGATRDVLIRAPHPGRYPFHCSENMYFGAIIAR